MILAAFILIGIGMRLQAFDFIESDDYDLLSSWNIKSAQGEPRIKAELQERFELNCGDLHQTDAAPFTAIVLFKSSGRLLCMGAIIDRSHILSSKRCIGTKGLKDLLVVAGYYKPWWGEHAQIRPVTKIIKHEIEIALLKLKERLIFTDYIKYIKLPPAVPRGGTPAKPFEKMYPPPYLVVGFFVNRLDEPGSFLSKETTYDLKLDKFLDFDRCKQNYTKLQLDSKKLFCIFGEALYCWGGGGSPVILMEKGSYMLIGIVTAVSCTEDTTGPFAAARTDIFGEWIRQNSHMSFVKDEE